MTDAFDPVIFSSVCSGLTMTSFQLLSGRTEATIAGLSAAVLESVDAVSAPMSGPMVAR